MTIETNCKYTIFGKKQIIKTVFKFFIFHIFSHFTYEVLNVYKNKNDILLKY